MKNATLFILSIIYLVIELVFNVQFINILYTDTMYYYPSLEFFGRHVSSIGATLLFLRLGTMFLSGKKFIIVLILMPAFYYGFFNGQIKFIDYVVDQSSVEFKEQQAINYVSQKGYSNGSIKNKSIQAKSELYNADDAVYLATHNFVKLSNNSGSNNSKISKESLVKYYNHVLNHDFKMNNKYYQSLYSDAISAEIYLYQRYTSAQASVRVQNSITTEKAENAWSEKIAGENKALKNYNMVKRQVSKEMNTFYKEYSREIGGRANIYLGCDDEKCRTNQENALRKLQSSNKYNVSSNFSFAKNCVVKNDGSKVGTYTVLSRSSKAIKGRKSGQYFNTVSGSRAECFFDVRSVEDKVLARITNKWESKTGLTDLSYSDVNAFVSQGGLTKLIKNKMLNDYGVKLPANWNRKDKKTFMNTIMTKSNVKVSSKVNEAMMKEFGFIVPINLTKEGFLNNKNIKRVLKNKIGFFYDNGIIKINAKSKSDFEKAFFNAYESRVKRNIGNDFYNRTQDSEYLDSIFKATILPLVSISLSLVFGIVNFIFIFSFIVSSALKMNKKNTLFLNTGLLLGALIIPFFITNHYTGNENFQVLMSQLKDGTLFLGYFYNWFINTEVIVFKLFGELVLNFDIIAELLKIKV